MAKPVEKATYLTFFKKGEEHEACGDGALASKRYNAAVTNYSIAIINYLDALSVNRFGRDLSSGHHPAAPDLLHKSLNGAGITDFKRLAGQCRAALQMKNAASYRADEITVTDARLAKKTTQQVKSYVTKKFDRNIT